MLRDRKFTGNDQFFIGANEGLLHERPGADVDAGKEVMAYLVTGESPLSTNTFAEPGHITIEERVMRADEIVLPPHSFAMLEVRLKRG